MGRRRWRSNLHVKTLRPILVRNSTILNILKMKMVEMEIRVEMEVMEMREIQMVKRWWS